MNNFRHELKTGIRFIFNIILPQRKEEKVIFGVFFFLFACLSFFSFYNTSFDSNPSTEIIGYDIGGRFHYLSKIKSLLPFLGNIRHPLLSVIVSPIIILGWTFKTISGEYQLNLLVIMLAFNLISSFSILIIYKYLRNLLEISFFRTVILCLLFSLFAQVLILSFLPESFPISMFGLLITIYATTDNIMYKKKIPWSANLITFFFVAGVTITNGLKCIFAQLFQNEKWSHKIRIIFICGTTFLVATVLSFLITYYASILHFGEWRFHDNTDSFLFQQTKNTNLTDELLLEPVLFHEYDNFFCVALEDSLTYNSFYQEYSALLLYILLIISIVVNIRKKTILLLMSFILVDILVHFIFKFGFTELHIYALHWLFIFPLLLGWLYKYIKLHKLKLMLDSLLILLLLCFGLNNIPRIYHFILSF